MKLAALTSGGKDSILAIQKALDAGHTVTHMITVVPENKESYMFHSANLAAVRVMAERAGMEYQEIPPKLLLLDEPSMGLAPLLVKEIFNIIKEINASGTTVLLVEQNANMALSIADKAYVLETGRITLSGTAAELASSEEVRKAYLGG